MRATSAWAALLLCALAVAAYSNALGNPFVFDDGVAIERNLRIRTLWPPWIMLSPPRDTPVAGRPVVNATFALGYAAGGLDPRGHRVVNLALHTACAWLLFAVLRRTLRARRAATPDAVAIAAAAVWVVHPLASEVVDYVSQRSESLMALCTLLVLLGVARAAGATGARERRVACVLAFVACALGMATKEAMVASPILAFLYDAVYCAGSAREAWRRRRALHVSLAASWLVLLALHMSTPRGLSVGFGHGVTPATYLAHQMLMLTTYLSLVLWPHPLVLDYGWPLPIVWRDVLAETAIVALWILGAALVFWRRPAAGFPLVAGLLVLAPSSSFVPIATEVGAERRFYLPLAGLIALAAACAGAWLARAPRARVARGVAAAATALLVALLLLVTRARNEDYASEERIWRGAVAVRPGQPRPLLALAQTLREQGRPDEALPLVQAALRAWPSYVQAELQHALLAEDRGDLTDAELHLRRALALDPDDGETRSNLGELLARSGRVALAIALWQQALARDPGLAYAANNLAWLRATHPDPRLRDGGEAVALAERAVRGTVGMDAGVLDTLGAAYAENGRFEDAVAAADRALHRARADGDDRLAAANAERRAAYQQDLPVRVDPGAPAPAALLRPREVSSGGSGT